jgi:hypothetical protein
VLEGHFGGQAGGVGGRPPSGQLLSQLAAISRSLAERVSAREQTPARVTQTLG